MEIVFDDFPDHILHLKKIITDVEVKDLIETIPWNEKTKYFGRMYSHNALDSVIVNHVINQIEHKIKINNQAIEVLGVFANYYRDGNDKTGFHTDQYGYHVLTCSFGGTRPFQFKKKGETKVSHKYLLEHGDVFFFDDYVNHNYMHAIPVSKMYNQPRVSLLLFFR